MTQPAKSREEYDVKIKNAEAAGDKGAVIELTRRRDEKFPAPAGERARPTGETGQSEPPGPPVQWGMVDEAANTATFGLGPQAVAGGMALVKGITDFENVGDAYTNYRGRQKAAQEKYRAENPNASQLGQVAGFAGNIGTVAEVPARVVPAATAGGFIGGVQGFSSTEGGIVEKLIGAAKGAGVGATIGAASAYGARGGGWTWDSVRRAVQEGSGVHQRSVEKIVEELRHQGLTPQQAGEAARRLGPEGMIADASPGMQQMTAATGAVEPGAASIITPRLRGRREGGGPDNSPGAQVRTRGALDQAFGPYRDPWNVRQENIANRAAIGPQYETAIANAPQLPRTLDDLIAHGTTPAMRQAANTLGNLSAPGRRTMGGYFENIDDALGADTPQQTVSRLHDIRKRVSAQISDDTYGMSSADKADQGALRSVRDIVDDILKNQVPGFREADEAFAPIEQQREAYEQGRTKVYAQGPSTMTEGEFVHRQGQSTPEVNDARVQGMRSDLERRASNERLNAGVQVDRVLGRDFNRRITDHAVGPWRSARLAQELEGEGTMLETSNMAEAGRGSRTAPLTETARRIWGAGRERGALADMAAAGIGGTLAGGPGAGAAAAGAVGAQRLGAAAANRLSQPATDVIVRTADNLTLTGARRDALVRALVDEVAQLPIREQSRARAEAIVKALLLVTTAPAGEAAAHFGGPR